jgi:PPK2 family polyphosphate:nucleotide phosphotransferase
MASRDRVKDAFRVDKDVLAASDLPDPGGRPVGPDKKSKANKELLGMGERLDGLQEALYAEGTAGGKRSLLLVLQGMDTSGKGGTVRHVLGLVNPMGVHYAAFKKPTPAERRHHFLWRIRAQLPKPGQIGVFDRSHYEDILVPRVQKLLRAAEWEKRYTEIAVFERELVDSGTTVVKVFLHISPEEQLRRLKARLVNPAKWWKYDPADLDARAQWADYQAAYRDVMLKTSTEVAPWFIVPADRKWYRNWVVANLIAETLDEMGPRHPAPGFDPGTELSKLERVGVPG